MRNEALSAQPADGADLSSVFRQILERAANRPTLTVTNDSVIVCQMVDYLRDRLEIEVAPISLEEAIGGSSSSRIVTAAIPALLEMVRLGAVLLRQDAQGASIRIKKSPEFQQSWIQKSGSKSEADTEEAKFQWQLPFPEDRSPQASRRRRRRWIVP